MTSRRALIVAPLYDGEWLSPLPGRNLLVERLTKCLETFGKYEVKALNGLVEEDVLRAELARFFDTDGELLFYFYGHGCLRPPGLGVFAVSSDVVEGVASVDESAITGESAPVIREIERSSDMNKIGIVTVAWTWLTAHPKWTWAAIGMTFGFIAGIWIA